METLIQRQSLRGNIHPHSQDYLCTHIERSLDASRGCGGGRVGPIQSCHTHDLICVTIAAAFAQLRSPGL